jgi:hypothetical protein
LLSCVRAAAVAAWLVFFFAAGAPALADPMAPPAVGGAVVISEFMAEPFGTQAASSLRDDDGAIVDWIELHNRAADGVDLSGWSLTDKADNLRRWQFPPGVIIPPNGYLVVFASGKDRAVAGKELHTNFALDRSGEYLALVNAAGEIVQSYSPAYAYQYTGVAYGPADVNDAAGRYLLPATPGLPNGSQGPVIAEVTRQPVEPNVGQNIGVQARVVRNEGGVTGVRAYLHYRFGFGPERLVEMVAGADGVYAAEIPASAQKLGDLVRYYITAVEEGAAEEPAAESRWPLPCWRSTLQEPYPSSAPAAYNVWLPAVAAPEETAAGIDYVRCPLYLGTVMGAAALERQTQLPMLHWFVPEDPVSGWEWYRPDYDAHVAAGNPAWSFPDSSTRAVVYYAGRLYDNVAVQLAGAGSKAFSKKSLNFDFNRDDRIYLRGTEIPGMPFDASTPLTKLHVPTTGWDESYVRQALAWRAYALAQVPSSLAFQARLQLNGAFFSVITVVEPIHTPYFLRNGLEVDSTLFKSQRNSLLRAPSGLPADAAAGVSQQRPDNLDRTLALGAFINGINPADSGLEARVRATAYAYDHVNIPEVINYMAVRTVLDDFDTLWHNFLVQQDLRVERDQLDDRRWYGTGEWTLIPWDKDYIFLRLNGIYPAGAAHPFFGAVGRDQKVNGLFDLVLQDAELRAMYLRRLRSVMDLVLGADAARSWIDAYADQLLARVAPDAQRDTERYTGPAVPRTDLAIAAFNPSGLHGEIEKRRRELYDVAPGKFGDLIPQAQGSPTVHFGGVEPAGSAEQVAITLVNCGSQAVDLSNWTVQNEAGQIYRIKPGVVLPGAGGRLYITPDVAAFRTYKKQQRSVDTLGWFVQGGFDPRLLGVMQGGELVPSVLTLRNGNTVVATNQAPPKICP